MKRIKSHITEKSKNPGSLEIVAMGKTLAVDKGEFHLRDASTGDSKEALISNEEMNQHLGAIRNFDFQV